MKRLQVASGPHKQRRAGPSVLLAAILPALISCTAVAPQDVTARQAATVFPRLVDPSGCVIEQITFADHTEHQVQGASPDGRKLLMAGNLEGSAENDTIYEAYEVDLATGERTDLSHVLGNSGPYSPDGRFNVVAQDTENGKTDIFEYERATGQLRAIAAHEAWDWLPGYSPDGRFIVFNSYRVDGQSDIHLFEKSTGTLQRITEFDGYDAHAQFSPDGKRILFHRMRGRREDGGYLFDLMVYDVATGRETRLTDGDFEEGYPAWAPDGRHIVFSSDVDGQPGKVNLYILAPGGRTTTRLTQGDWNDEYAFWTRDGKFIYFNSNRAGAKNIYRMLMDGLDCVRRG